ncbi:MAG TPA: hypothetical protein VNA19_10110 [Pyrinomonadaceae bacterium]|nr:hypothetical protein [Pyrinomonadaceae bacterium]
MPIPKRDCRRVLRQPDTNANPYRDADANPDAAAAMHGRATGPELRLQREYQRMDLP